MNTEGPRALLWDLDNVAPPRADLVALAWGLRGACGRDPVLVAAGHRGVARSARRLLEPVGFTVLSGGSRRDGADYALLAEHRRMLRRGVARVAVASGDRIFQKVAQRSEVVVFTLRPSQVSLKLVACASAVIVFEPSAQGYVPRDVSGPRSE